MVLLDLAVLMGGYVKLRLGLGLELGLIELLGRSVTFSGVVGWRLSTPHLP